MRIAVSGAHCSGKSTLIDDFLAAHPDYVHEPEPYEWLVDLYGEDVGGEPGVDDFFRQLEVSVERLSSYPRGARVIAERSPLDFIAYLQALECEPAVLEQAVALANKGMEHVDLLVVLPIDGVAAPESEDLELRQAVNDCLLELVGEDVLELRGTRQARLAALESRLVS